MTQAVINGKPYKVKILKPDEHGYKVQVVGSNFDGVIIWVDKKYIKTPKISMKCEYVIDREEVLDHSSGRYYDKISSRNIVVYMNCKDKNILEIRIYELYNIFENYGLQFSMCDTVNYNEVTMMYEFVDSMAVQDIDEANDLKNIWKEFKGGYTNG